MRKIYDYLKTHQTLIIIVLALLLIMQFRSCRPTPAIPVEAKPDSTEYFKDAYGREHARVVLRESDLVDVKLLYGKQLAQKAEELKVQAKRIQSLVSFGTSRQLNLDSLIHLYATIDTFHITRDTTIYVPHFKNVYVPVLDSLGVTQYSKRVNLFKRQDMIDVLSYYPDVTVKAVQGFRITRKPNNLSFGPTLTWSWTPQGMRIVPGIGIQWNLIGLRVGR